MNGPDMFVKKRFHGRGPEFIEQLTQPLQQEESW